MTRGRPPKFGRPAALVALTLPRDVLNWLRTINTDPAWAIVSLFERSTKSKRPPEDLPQQAQLVSVGNRRALIVVDPTAVGKVPGVSLVPLSAGRSFLALQPGKGIADLELAVMDRLEEPSVSPDERRGLKKLRRDLREWRRDRELNFEMRSIIVVERQRRGSSTRVKATSGSVAPRSTAPSNVAPSANPQVDGSLLLSASLGAG